MPATLLPTLRELDPDDIVDEYTKRGLDQLSDAALVDLAAEVVGRPKLADPSSFVLHAPLELLARIALVHHASPAARERARQRIAWLTASYDAAGPPTPLEAPAPPSVGPDVGPDVGSTVDALLAAIGAGDLQAAGSLGWWLGRTVDARRLVSLVGDVVVDSLAAASHGAIFLHLLPRVAPRSALAGSMFATMAHELARHPDWRLGRVEHPGSSTRSLTAALAGTPVIGPSGEFGIYSTMTFTEAAGVLDETAGMAAGADLDVDHVTTAVLRVATASMLLDDPDHAPYGWSHALTIPQAMASVAPLVAHPDRAVVLAASHLVGFRATEGKAALDTVDPEVAATGLVSALPRHRSIQEVIDHAAVHPDAHLAKYVVACLDAARTDPAGAAQHLAAAAHLDAWWRQLPVTDDPLVG